MGRNLLFSSQPFATKLANTLSACVLVIGDVSVFTSRSAAREEMEYELFGASIICSTWSERSAILKYCSRKVSYSTYQCSKVGYLEGCIVTRDTRNFVVSTINLKSCFTFTRCGWIRGRKTLPGRTSPFLSLHCVFVRVPSPRDRVIC
jgi:hypothetical protein